MGRLCAAASDRADLGQASCCFSNDQPGTECGETLVLSTFSVCDHVLLR